MQGPFSASEMAEWFNAAYFNYSLLVKRQCDDSFYRLGDLVQTFSGNPFLAGVAQRIPPLKQEVAAPDNAELLQYQLLQRQLALRQAASLRAMGTAEPWNALSGMQQQQQRELLGQQVLGHPQVIAIFYVLFFSNIGEARDFVNIDSWNHAFPSHLNLSVQYNSKKQCRQNLNLPCG